jgi:hypothetical protein
MMVAYVRNVLKAKRRFVRDVAIALIPMIPDMMKTAAAFTAANVMMKGIE